jgi:hypothetical protein
VPIGAGLKPRIFRLLIREAAVGGLDVELDELTRRCQGRDR